MNQAEIEAILDRPLTQREIDNFDSYIASATDFLRSILNRRIEKASSASDRVFVGLEGYESLPVDIFNGAAVITLNTRPIEAFVRRQGERYEGDWFDTIEFSDPMCGDKYVINANWGFTEYPYSLQVLIANAFVVVSGQINANIPTQKIKSETSLSHSVTYETATNHQERFIEDNVTLVNQWKRYDSGLIAHPSHRRYWS